MCHTLFLVLRIKQWTKLVKHPVLLELAFSMRRQTRNQIDKSAKKTQLCDIQLWVKLVCISGRWEKVWIPHIGYVSPITLRTKRVELWLCFLTLPYIVSVLHLQYPMFLFDGCFHKFKNSSKYKLFPSDSNNHIVLGFYN